MPEGAKTLADLTPTRLTSQEPVAVEDTDLRATLTEWSYGRGRGDDGRERVIAWAEIRFEAPDGTTEDVHWSFSQQAHAMGHRFYLTGSRSEVLLYTLPG